MQMQKQYWRTYCHKIGYAPRINKKQVESWDRESSPDYTPSSSRAKSKGKAMDYEKLSSRSSDKHGGKTVCYSRPPDQPGAKTTYSRPSDKHGAKTVGRTVSVNENGRTYNARGRESSEEPSSPSVEETSDGDEAYRLPRRGVNGTSQSALKTPGKNQSGKALPPEKMSDVTQQEKSLNGGMDPPSSSPSNPQVLDRLREENRILNERLQLLEELKEENRTLKEKMQVLDQLKEENHMLKERLKGEKEEKLRALEHDLQGERDKCKSIEIKLHDAVSKLNDLNKEQESLIDIFSEERERRDREEENLRKKLRDASSTIEELRKKVMKLDSMNSSNGRR